MKNYFNKLFVMVIGLELIGCSLFGVKQLYTPDPSQTYRHELLVTINGYEFKGVGVVKRAASYVVQVQPAGNIDRIMWRTCAREEVVDKPDSHWWDSSYTFTLNQVPGLEDVTACGLQITVLEEKKRRNGFAFFDFEDSREEVSTPANLVCNGLFERSSGVSVCQSAAGLYQQITFGVPMVQSGASPQCNVMKPYEGDEKVYRFEIPAGECSYYFVAKERAGNGKRFIHRLTTIGYTDVPPIKM